MQETIIPSQSDTDWWAAGFLPLRQLFSESCSACVVDFGFLYSFVLRNCIVLSVRPKVAELAFQVFSRSLHPELYTIHKSRRIERSHYEAQVDITNCGHVITWNAAGVTICEVATSAHQPLPKRRCLLAKSLKGSRTERAQCRDGIEYRTHFQLESVEPDLFWMVQQQLGEGPTEGLLHTFDASGRMALGALSYVNVETRHGSMLVQAIHTFPDDYAIVKVESLFSLPADKTAN